MLATLFLCLATAPLPSTSQERSFKPHLLFARDQADRLTPSARPTFIDWSQNIGHIALEVEKALHDDYILCDLERGFIGMEDNHRLLERLFEEAENRIPVKNEYTEAEAIRISATIHRILKEQGFRYRNYREEEHCLLGDTMFGTQLARKEIDCVAYGLLGLSIAEHLELPLSGIYMPGHFALRWRLADGESFNLELSIPARCDDAFYESWKGISKATIKNGSYLRDLTKQEVIAQQFYNLSLVWENRGRIDLAAGAIDRALRLFSLFPDAYNVRGLLHRSIGMIPEALRDFDLAIALDSAFKEARFNRKRTVEGREILPPKEERLP